MNKSSMLNLIIACAMSFLCLIACGGGGSSGGNQELAKIDIVGAESLFIAGTTTTAEGASLKSATTINKLFKITPNGYIQEVTYTDKDGKTVTLTNQPVAVYNANTNFVIVVFGYNNINPRDSYLVRKSDGAVYQIGKESEAIAGHIKAPIQMNNYFKNSSPVMTDDSNLIYFHSYGHSVESGGLTTYTVYRISDPYTTPSIVDYIPETDTIDTYTVDGSGNLFYSGYIVSDLTVAKSRIKKLNGELENFEPYNRQYWKAVDRAVYYLVNVDTSEGARSQIKRMTVDADFNVIETNYGDPLILFFTPYDSYLVNISGKTLIIIGGTESLKVADVFNSSNTPTVVDLSGVLNSISSVTASDTYYYIAGTDTTNKGVLKKCEAATHTCSDLLAPGQYDVYSMVASSADKVTFNALRMSDGAKILASADDAGTVSVLDETLNTQVTMLERVN